MRIGFDQLDPRILPDMGVKVSFLDDRAGEPEPQAASRPAVRVPSEADHERRRDDVRLAGARRRRWNGSRSAPVANVADRQKCCRESPPATSL